MFEAGMFASDTLDSAIHGVSMYWNQAKWGHQHVQMTTALSPIPQSSHSILFSSLQQTMVFRKRIKKHVLRLKKLGNVFRGLPGQDSKGVHPILQQDKGIAWSMPMFHQETAEYANLKLSGLATESFGHRYWLFRVWHDSQDTHFDAHKQALKNTHQQR